MGPNNAPFLLNPELFFNCSETGALCAMKEVELFPDDPKSAECIKQLEQVSSRRETIGRSSVFGLFSNRHLIRNLFLCQEIKLLSNLQHPNIVQYFGSEIVSISSVYMHITLPI